MKPSIPIYLFTGFLGSGKTTLLKNALDYFSRSGKKAAVIMNEIGEINVESQSFKGDIPVAEILGGCICCSVSGDLKTTIINLSSEFEPDVIIIESTGVASPKEMISSITEAMLHTKVHLKLIVTVLDALHLLDISRMKLTKTLELMEEQIRFGEWLILNKIDKVTNDEMKELKNKIQFWNPLAYIQTTMYGQADFDYLDTLVHRNQPGVQKEKPKTSHDHVMVYTHYFDRLIERQSFEDLMNNLPENIYRAKGILQFNNKKGPFLFQYAYRELEMIRITPKTNLTNVAVFIGENFSKEKLIQKIERLSVDLIID